MFDKLKIADCLFVIEEEDLSLFQRLASTVPIHTHKTVRLQLDSRNLWGTALNIWCMLNEKAKDFHMNSDKMMIFSSNFHCLELLRNEKQLQSFLKSQHLTPEIIYVIAYLLASEITIVVRESLAATSLGTKLNARNLQRDYFMMSDSDEFSEEVKREFYKDQNIIIKALLHAISDSRQFEKRIGYVIQGTRQYMMEMELIK